MASPRTDDRCAIHIALPCHRRRALTDCAVEALARTMQQPYKVWIVENDDPLLWARGIALDPRNGSEANGIKLDLVLGGLPLEAEWLFTMHSDAAPLALGWFEWLQDRIGQGEMGGFLATRYGRPHPMGALYRVGWLRESHATFLPVGIADVGDSVPLRSSPFISRFRGPCPWWLRRADVGYDHQGHLLYAHLGGGTIGASSRRIPWWAWPILVRHHLNRRCAP